MIKFKVDMLVCRFDLGIAKVNCYKIARWLGGVYNPRKFPGAVIKFGKNKAIIIARSGKGIITGIRSMAEINKLLDDLAEYLRLDKRKMSVKVVNIIASCRLNKRINLHALANIMNGIYMPETFPNMRARLHGVLLNISGDGGISVLGARNLKTIKQVEKELEHIFSTHPEVFL